MEAVKTTAVTCPDCGLSRDLDLSRLPDDVHRLVCPRCRHPFELRSGIADEADRYYSIRKRPPRSQARKTRPPLRSAPAAEIKTPPSFEAEEEEVLELIIDEEPAADDAFGSTAIPFPTAPGTPPAGIGGIPWENQGSFPVRYMLTVLKILFGPTHFFKAMSLGQGYKPSRQFAVSTITIVGLVWAVQFVMLGINYWEMPLTRIAPMLIVPVIILPIFYGILIFIQAGLFHFLLQGFKVVESGYQATFRLVAYSAAAKLWLIAPQDWMFIPIAWTALLYYMGIKAIAGKKPNAAGIIICALMAAAEIYGLSHFWHYLLFFDFFRLW